MNFTFFFKEQQKLLRVTQTKLKRYLYDKIDFNNKAVIIVGQRGVGKTTLMLQYLKENYKNSSKALYISVDNPYFKTISLYEFASMFESFGGEILFIDEIHKYKDWELHIKSIIDTTSLKLIISGSSMIQIHSKKADLSRRIVVYELANLSFREYIYFTKKINLPSFDLEDVFLNHIECANVILQKIKPLEFFYEYLEYGNYPFILKKDDSYESLLISIINQILEVDLPYIANINFAQIDKIKKLIYLLSISVPLKPNISKLSNASEISRPTLLEYIYYLEKGRLINIVNFKSRGYNILTKPDKLYINNTNLTKAISKEANIGTLREIFFVNQIKSYFYNQPKLLDENILLSNKGDFLIQNKYIVEIGGKNKSFKQIKDIDNSFIVADDIEIGFKNKIPLWLFGFLY